MTTNYPFNVTTAQQVEEMKVTEKITWFAMLQQAYEKEVKKETRTMQGAENLFNEMKADRPDFPMTIHDAVSFKAKRMATEYLNKLP